MWVRQLGATVRALPFICTAAFAIASAVAVRRRRARITMWGHSDTVRSTDVGALSVRSPSRLTRNSSGCASNSRKMASALRCRRLTSPSLRLSNARAARLGRPRLHQRKQRNEERKNSTGANGVHSENFSVSFVPSC